MTAGGITCGAGQGNDLSLADSLAYTNKDQRIVAIAGHDPMAVVYGHAVSRVPCPGGYDDLAIFASSHRRAAGNWIVLADVDLATGPGWISAPSVRAGNRTRGNGAHELK